MDEIQQYEAPDFRDFMDNGWTPHPERGWERTWKGGLFWLYPTNGTFKVRIVRDDSDPNHVRLETDECASVEAAKTEAYRLWKDMEERQYEETPEAGMDMDAVN